MMKNVICEGNNNRIYYIENGYLCSGIKGIRTMVKPTTIVKHGLYEGDELK
jgi:hypothetical protein